MILLVDRGNSRLKWRLIDGAEVCAESVDSDEFEAFRAQSLRGVTISLVIYASVAERSVNVVVRTSVLSLFGDSTEFVHIRTLPDFLGFRAAYSAIETMGVDRWLQLLVAHRESVYPALVVSLGTAMTVDKIDENGKHVGGLIAPGWAMLSSVVQSSAAQIDVDLPEAPFAQGLGFSTAECLHKGVSHMLMSFLDRAEREFGRDCRCKMMSGGGSVIADGFDGFQKRETLVLDGLAVVAENFDEYQREVKMRGTVTKQCD